MYQIEVDVDFTVYYIFQSQIIDLTNAFAQSYNPRGKQLFIEITRDFNIDKGLCISVIIFKTILYVKAEAANLCYEKLQDVFKDRGFVTSKVSRWLLIYKTVICLVYADDCLFGSRSEFNINKIMKSFN